MSEDHAVLPLPELPKEQTGTSVAKHKHYTASVRPKLDIHALNYVYHGLDMARRRSRCTLELCQHTAVGIAHPLQVSNAAGYLCHIHLECNLEVPPEVIFEIFCHPGQQACCTGVCSGHDAARILQLAAFSFKSKRAVCGVLANCCCFHAWQHSSVLCVD